MIYTITFNPAIDYVVHINKLKKGSIMRSQYENCYFGGKGINVSLILKELGVSSVATGFTAGFTGEAIEKGIASDLVKTDFVRLKDGLTRINVKIRSGEETDINGNGPVIGKEEIERLFEKLEKLQDGDFLILSGSVPKTLPTDIYERILATLENKGICFVVDAERELLLRTLKYKPFLIKPNEQELGEIFGTEISSAEDALKYAEKLKSLGALNVLVSLGEKGAVLLDADGKEHYAEAYKGNFVNSVGAGDSMVAGFIAGYCRKKDYEYALRLGNAAGGATAFSEGLATGKQIMGLL